MIHRVVWRVGSPAALDFWANGWRPRHRGPTARATPALRRPRGARARAAGGRRPDEPLIAEHPEVPPSTRSRASTPCAPTPREPERSRELLEEGLGFEPARTRAGRRAATSAAGSTSTTPRPPSAASRAPAACTTRLELGRRGPRGLARARAAERRAPTPVIDRHYFSRSTSASRAACCSRSPRPSPGFTIDEPLETSARSSRSRRGWSSCAAEIEDTVRPLENPRMAARTRRVGPRDMGREVSAAAGRCS